MMDCWLKFADSSAKSASRIRLRASDWLAATLDWLRIEDSSRFFVGVELNAQHHRALFWAKQPEYLLGESQPL